MGWLRDWKRRRILKRHRIDDALWRRAKKHLPFLRGLAAHEERRLKELAVVFLAEKQLTPVHGLTLSEDDRIEIALQACLPVLELGLDWYDGWVGIVVHPSDFKVQRARTGEDGVVHEWDDELVGESWPGGPVVLSWEALDDAGSVAQGGANVVIHEFAHKLDMTAGEADGVPPLPSREARERWVEVFDAEFDRFCKAVDAGKEALLDSYAAEHEAEFFAVASEAFFETPNALRREFPALYRLFSGFYRQDPARRLES
jgi:Mlc titration factor MtfA (ptsG expression regulator)